MWPLLAALAYDPTAGTLWLASNSGSGNTIHQYSTNGTLLQSRTDRAADRQLSRRRDGAGTAPLVLLVGGLGGLGLIRRWRA